MLTDDERERIAIEVEHLPEGEAAAEYERRVRYELNRRRLRERLAKQSGGIYQERRVMNRYNDNRS